MNVRLFEIFTSIEGEGLLCGTKTMFVRLAGCPFTCFYCDTPEALPADSGTEYSIDSACKMIEDALEPHTYKVNFTGGDPLLQHEVVAMMAKFVQSKKIPTYIESSCYDSKRFAVVLPFIDIVKIEFKTSDSDFTDKKHYDNLLDNAFECLDMAVSADKTTYIKIVVSSRTTKDIFAKLVQNIFDRTSSHKVSGFVIQPTTGVSEPSLGQLLQFYDIVRPVYEQVRIVPQLHKLIGAP